MEWVFFIHTVCRLFILKQISYNLQKKNHIERNQTNPTFVRTLERNKKNNIKQNQAQGWWPSATTGLDKMRENKLEELSVSRRIWF